MNNLSSVSLGLIRVLLGTSRRNRQIVLIFTDITTFFVAISLSILLRFEGAPTVDFIAGSKWHVLMLILIQGAVFQGIGIYRPVLRYSYTGLILIITKAVTLSTLITISSTYFLGYWPLTRSVLIINALLVLVLVVAGRVLISYWIRYFSRSETRQKHPRQQLQRLLVYGAGGAGAELLQSLKHHPTYIIIGFVDDNSDKHYASIDGYRVYPFNKIQQLWFDNKFDLVVLAMPSLHPSKRRQIVKQLQQIAVPVKTVPHMGSILSGEVKINEIRDVDVADLLGRQEAPPDLQLLRKQTHNRGVLVTGAGGSIGSELCRQIAQQQPRCLVLYELNEFALYQIHQELSETHSQISCIPCLGNVGDTAYLSSILRTHQIETIYHAAAYKHVPLLENNVAKGVENNVKGTLSVVRCAIATGVNQFVLISTDKAVRPTNVMGTTKRVTELIVQASAAQPDHSTCFAIVRFGNVLGSSGSVVPRFRDQIARGGPITLTHPDITRYFMSIPEAARLVIQAGAMARGGEVFLLDMGEPVKIYDLATQMIRLSGLVPEDDIAINITGLRPGEKLYEELLISGDNVKQTRHEQIYCSEEYFLPWEKLEPQLNRLFQYAEQNDIQGLKQVLKQLVPESTIQVNNSGPESKSLSLLLPSPDNSSALSLNYES